jgi:hypothetical protein
LCDRSTVWPVPPNAEKLDKRVKLLHDWRVNRPQDEQKPDWLRRCVRRGQPYGDEAWVRRTAVKLGLESSLRPVGRPNKTPEKKRNGF